MNLKSVQESSVDRLLILIRTRRAHQPLRVFRRLARTVETSNFPKTLREKKPFLGTTSTSPTIVDRGAPLCIFEAFVPAHPGTGYRDHWGPVTRFHQGTFRVSVTVLSGEIRLGARRLPVTHRLCYAHPGTVPGYRFALPFDKFCRNSYWSHVPPARIQSVKRCGIRFHQTM
eukprot:3211808-Rhodomonas_salina.1